MRSKILIGLSTLAVLLLIRNLYVMLLQFPDEMQQGGIFRIMFFHIPAAFTGLLAAFGAMAASIMYLVKKNLRFDSLAVAITEVGLAFGLINIITGMIWARIIWGIWWAWDARLTSSLVLMLLYAGYLMLRGAIEDPTQRARLSAVLSVFAAADVPIIWYSIEWWRTQHPQPVLRGAGSIPGEWKSMIYVNWIPILLLAIVFIMIRMNQEQAQRRVESLRQHAYAV